ncbi:DUF3618 domain-containing protein [Microlunatus aurantiacus]|uniref:DUF3618 domain-containing protein n=1 Tax=Microlunatus aurantiacus TaxID=446786 RepID=A0ABP7CSS4_9ACTN
MSQNDPEVLRAEIERTRAELSNNVDTLTDTANPKNIAHRQADKVKSAARGVREHLMGAPDDPYDAGTLGDRRDAVQDKVGAVQDRAAGALDTVADAPAQAKRKTRGNPLAAGLIAFGVGYLISSAIPSSEREQEAASRLQEKAAPLKEKVSEAAGEVAERLREPAQAAAASVKDAATEAVSNVKDEGVSAKDDVQGQVRDSADTVKGSATS